MTTRPAVAPAFRDLSKKAIDSLLKRNHVGRIAFSFHDAVDIRPIHYVYRNGWLFGRTSQSDKLVTLKHNQWVAFEVDEVTGPFDWQSVIVRGTFYRVADEGAEHDRRLYARALRAVREIAPAALTDDDVVAFRTELFAISINSVTGRSSSTRKRK